MLTPTAGLPTTDLREIRALLDASFDDFTDHDWEHGLGGLHAVVRADDGAVLAHGSLVLRRLLVEGRSLRCGYVEDVAVRADRRRRGLAGQVMGELESLAAGYDVLALSASEPGALVYLSRGWQLWRGPSSVLSPTGLEATPAEDGSIYVLPGAVPLDLDAPIACDWRDGDVW